MNNVIKQIAGVSSALGLCLSASGALAQTVSDNVISEQRKNLARETRGEGYGPQSPRDIEQYYGLNQRVFAKAPVRSQMNLCNIHFHKGAEHKGGQFTTYAGNGNGAGLGTGYLYNGELSAQQQAPLSAKVCAAKGEGLQSGDTIEVHYVFSTAAVEPGATLGACLADETMNPQLRVEAQVMVLANDENAPNFERLAQVSEVNGYYQAPNIPSDTGVPVEYSGSTTGPSYNEKGSPLQVSWSVRPGVTLVNAASVGEWCEDNEFEEDHAHGVRNLVVNPELLSTIY